MEIEFPVSKSQKYHNSIAGPDELEISREASISITWHFISVATLIL